MKRVFSRLTIGVAALATALTPLTALAVDADYTGWDKPDGEDGAWYWYENGVLQGYDASNPDYRGKEIYDEGSDGWYWLDNVQGGARAVSKDVYQESLAGDWGDITGDDGLKYGKWVRYDENGKMIKGWSDDGLYYFDLTYGTMAKGYATIDGQEYYFNTGTGVKEQDLGEVPEGNGWKEIDGYYYWYENGVRQGYSVDSSYRGKEIYDPESNAWYWLDNVDGGRKAVSKDVYQESQADDAGNIGKWVRYDANGRMIKGWCKGKDADAVAISSPDDAGDADLYYFDPTYGTMAKGYKTIDGVMYYFNTETGICEGEVTQSTRRKWVTKSYVEYDGYGNITEQLAESTYDDYGNQTYAKYTDGNGNFVRSVESTFFNTTSLRTNQVTKYSDGSSYTCTYEYDASGNKTRFTYDRVYGSGSTYSYYTVYTYDGNGNETQNEVYYKQNDTSVPGYKTVMTYNEDGDIVREDHYSYDTSTNSYEETPNYYNTYEYSEDGLTETEHCYYRHYNSSSSDVTYTESYYYVIKYRETSSGYRSSVSRFRYDAEGEMTYGWEYVYNDEDYPTEYKYYRYGSLSSRTVYERETVPEFTEGATYSCTVLCYDVATDGTETLSYKDVYTYEARIWTY